MYNVDALCKLTSQNARYDAAVTDALTGLQTGMHKEAAFGFRRLWEMVRRKPPAPAPGASAAGASAAGASAAGASAAGASAAGASAAGASAAGASAAGASAAGAAASGAAPAAAGWGATAIAGGAAALGGLGTARRVVKEYVQRNPLKATGVGAGLGFVAGSGLFGGGGGGSRVNPMSPYVYEPTIDFTTSSSPMGRYNPAAGGYYTGRYGSSNNMPAWAAATTPPQYISGVQDGPQYKNPALMSRPERVSAWVGRNLNPLNALKQKFPAAERRASDARRVNMWGPTTTEEALLQEQMRPDIYGGVDNLRRRAAEDEAAWHQQQLRRIHQQQ